MSKLLCLNSCQLMTHKASFPRVKLNREALGGVEGGKSYKWLSQRCFKFCIPQSFPCHHRVPEQSLRNYFTLKDFSYIKQHYFELFYIQYRTTSGQFRAATSEIVQ